MRHIFIFLIFMISTLPSFSQSCDIYTTGLKTAFPEIIQGQTTDLVFSIKNEAKGISCAYAAKSVQVYLFLPEEGLVFEQLVFPSGGKGTFFNWTYDVDNKTLIGLNHQPISDGQGDENVTVRVKADKLNKPFTTKTIGLSIVQYHEGAVFPANNETNDNSILTLRLKTHVSQQNIQLEAFNSDCNMIDIVVTPDNIKDIVGFDILRSSNDKNYSNVGSISVDKNTRQGVYTFSDNQGLESGNSYSYIIQVLSRDGSSKNLMTEPIKNDCSVQKPDFSFFPNPVVDKMYLKLLGSLKNEVVDLVFTNVAGEQVSIIKGISNNQNEVDLQGIPSGVYFIKLFNKENLQSKRFVKIQH